MVSDGEGLKLKHSAVRGTGRWQIQRLNGPPPSSSCSTGREEPGSRHGAAAGVWERLRLCITWERRSEKVENLDEKMRSETTDISEQHVYPQMFQSWGVGVKPQPS